MNKKQKNIALVVFIVVVIGYVAAQQMMNSTTSISANDAHAQLMNDTSIVLLDVRTPEEHYSERITNSPLIPVHELEQRIHELDAYKHRTIIVYCRSGNRSGSATTILRKHGFNALNMQGGIIRWKSEQFKTTIGSAQ